MVGATPLPFFLAALVPAAIAFPLRVVLFGDGNPFTQVFLGPFLEESVKLAATFVALTVAAVVLPRGRDPVLVLQYWLFLAPWFIGGFFGFAEGILAYPGQGGLDFSLREAAHAAFAAWSLMGTLLVWRGLDAGPGGAILGGFAGFAAHVGFNLIAFMPGEAGALFWQQAAYAGVLVALGLFGLALIVRREPSSDEARRFLAVHSRD